MTKKRKLSPNQDIAANPLENIWVQANAGTGKTSVLVQRLLRILFRSNDLTHSGILCLTYTNAGAGEMRNRILAALRDWATVSDAELREMLEGVSVNATVSDADIAHAREIFYFYIDNPDVLKIKTIHGFCEEILRRFPLEAGLNPSWALVSDANQRVLLQDAFSELINSHGDEKIVNAFARIVNRVSENYMTDLLEILSGHYKYFFQINDFDKYRKYFIDKTCEFLNLHNKPNDGVPRQNLQNLIIDIENDIKTSKTPAKFLRDIVIYTNQYIDNTIDFEKYKNVYLTSGGTRNKNISKRDYLIAEQERVYALNQYNINKDIFDDTVALFDLSAVFASVYRKMKQQRGLLDFEDLILYTRKLFSDPESMGWVLSQLDLSLSHILVDEAQDTSPMQWDIMRMLAGDFFVDGDTDAVQHSLFVVGDTKQSIYGFQGADPVAFASSRQEIAKQISDNMRTIREIPLEQSFRSLPAILYTVDKFFDSQLVKNMTGFVNNKHIAFRRECSGLVEINRLVSKQEDNVEVREYICNVTDKIKEVIDSGRYTASDIMVLVQHRMPMVTPLVFELKKRGIDVAGSDRVVLPDYVPVRDLMNLVRFCMDVTDDYSLCCVLKSPVFSLSEADIFNLCNIKNVENARRKSESCTSELLSVWDVLQDTMPDVYEMLKTIIEYSKTMAPYSFFSKVLDEFDVRSKMIAALGSQVIDPLEEFMTICLSYERTQPGMIRQFIKWFITSGAEIKRDMDAESGVRIATVHGSKGLEAPIVFLVDTVRTPQNDKVVPLDVSAWLWSPRASNSVAYGEAVENAMKSKIAEYYRLLYVAMTRARDELYVYGYTPYKNAPDIAWHTMLWNVFNSVDNVEKSHDKIRIVHD